MLKTWRQGNKHTLQMIHKADLRDKGAMQVISKSTY